MMLFSIPLHGQWEELSVPSSLKEIVIAGDRLIGRTAWELFISPNRGTLAWDTLQTDYYKGGIHDLDMDGELLYISTSSGIMASEDYGQSFSYPFSWPWDDSRSIDVVDGYGWLAIDKWGSRSGPNRKTPQTFWTLRRGEGIPWSAMSMSRAVADPISPARVAYVSGISAFVTRDSGNTWVPSRRVVQALEYKEKTYAFSETHYSHDEGYTWEELNISGRIFRYNPVRKNY